MRWGISSHELNKYQMKGQLATGYVPYEIGDAVKLKKGDTVWKVTEIRLTQYVAAKTAEIHLQLLASELIKQLKLPTGISLTI